MTRTRWLAAGVGVVRDAMDEQAILEHLIGDAGLWEQGQPSMLATEHQRREMFAEFTPSERAIIRYAILGKDEP